MKQDVMQEILEITEKIQKEFPELYKYLRETPMLTHGNDGDMTTDGFKDYLESLKTQLADFEKDKNKHDQV